LVAGIAISNPAEGIEFVCCDCCVLFTYGTQWRVSVSYYVWSRNVRRGGPGHDVVYSAAARKGKEWRVYRCNNLEL